MWEGEWSFHAILKSPSLPKSPCVHQSRSSASSVFWGFYGGSITKAWLITSLAIGNWFNLQLSSPLQKLGASLKVSKPSNHMTDFLTISPILRSPNYLINITRDSFNMPLIFLVAQSYLTLCYPMDCSPPDSSVYGILQAHSLLQGIFLTWGLNPALLHCKQILYIPTLIHFQLS